MRQYHHMTRMLLDTDPTNPDWILERSYSHNNLAAVQLESGVGISEETLAHVAEAIRLMEMVVELRPDDKAVVSVYSTTLAWAAAAQFQVCSLDEALELRIRARELAKISTEANPGNNELRKQYAYSLTGVANAQMVIGKLDLAEQNLEFAISILQQLSAADPSNVHYHEEVLFRQVMLAKFFAETGQLQLAKSMMKGLEVELNTTGDFTHQGVIPTRDYIDFLLVYADVESQSGNVEQANRYLEAVIQLQTDSSDTQRKDIFDTQKLILARYQWWQVNGQDNFDGFPPIPEFAKISGGEFRSCTQAEFAARLYIIDGDRYSAAQEIAYLRRSGYADPNFMRFCNKNNLCEHQLSGRVLSSEQ